MPKSKIIGDAIEALAKILPEGLSDAEHLAARKAMSPEKTKEYFDLLEQAYGPANSRMKKMEFDSSSWFHGPKPNGEFDSVDLNKVKDNGSMGKGFYIAPESNKKLADVYSAKDLEPLHLKIKNADSFIDASSAITNEQIDKIKKIVDPEVIKYLENNDDLMPGKTSIAHVYRRISAEEAEQGIKNSLPKINKELKTTGLVEPNRQAVINDPTHVRLESAAFDPRYAKSGNLIAGAAAIPAANMSGGTMDAAKEALGAYGAIRDKVDQAWTNFVDPFTHALANQTNLMPSSMPQARQQMTNEMSGAMNTISNPLNFVEGPAGAALDAADLASSFVKPKGYSDGGAVEPQDFTPTAIQTFDRTGNQVQVDPRQLPDLYKSGQIMLAKGASIPMLDQTGAPVFIPPEKFEQAIDEGFSFDTPEMQHERFVKQKYTQPMEQVKAAAEAGARGVTLGLSDLALSGIGDQEAMRYRKELNPEIALGGEVVGTVAPMLLTGGGAGVAKGATGFGLKAIAEMSPVVLATKAGQVVEKELANVVGSEAAKGFARKVVATGLPKIAGSAVEGAIFGGGQFVSEAALGEADANAEQLMSHIGWGSLIGGGVGAGIAGAELATPVVQKIVDRIKPRIASGAKKAMSMAFGTSEEQLQRYIDRKPFIDALGEESVEDLAAGYYDKVKQISDDAAMAKLDAKGAEQSFKELEKEFKEELEKRKGLSREDLYRAKQSFNAKKEQVYKESLDGMLDSANEISQHVNALQDATIAESKTLTDLTLEGVEVKMNGLKRIQDSAQQVSKELGEKGTMYHAKAKEFFDGWLNLFNDALVSKGELSGATKMTGVELKERLLGLGQVLRDRPNDTILKPRLLNLYHAMSDELKKLSKPYAEHMAATAKEFELLKKLKVYADEGRGLSALKNFDDPIKIREHLPALKELESRYGGNFTEKIEQFLKKDEALAVSPEYKELVHNEALKNFVNNPEVSKEIQTSIQSSPEFQDMLMAQQAAKGALAEKEGLAGIAPGQVKGLFKQAAKGDQIAIKRLEAAGIDTQTLQDIGIRDSFGKAFHHGSRNPLIWGGLGAIFDKMGAGIVFGAAVDRFGPAMAKYVLDRYVTLASMEKMGIDIAKRVNENIKTFMDRKTLGGAIMKPISPLLEKHGAENKNKPTHYKYQNNVVSEYRQKKDVLERMTADAGILVDRIADQQSSVYAHAPQIMQAMATKTVTATQYLQQALPKDPLAGHSLFGGVSNWEPSEAEMAKFDRIETAVQDPLSILHDLNAGALSSDSVHAVKTIFPKLYDSLVMGMMDHLAESPVELSFEKKQMLSILLGQPVEFSFDPGFIQSQQALHAQKFSQQSGQSSGGQQMGQVNAQVASRRQTQTERVMTRT